jgi:signal transduction histidine kinase
VTLQVIAAFSLGVHVSVFLALGLVDAHAQVRAYRRFVGAITLWLGFHLAAALDIAPLASSAIAGAIAHALPLIFLLSAAVPTGRPSRGWMLGIGGVGAALLPFTLNVSPWHHAFVETAYFLAAWGGVAFRVAQGIRARREPVIRVGRELLAASLVAGSLAVGLLAAAGIVPVIPLIAAIIQILVMYGVMRFSLYEVREGASRTGALAADAAELDRRAVAGEIAAMVAHEVRNPLTGVRSLAQRMTGDELPDERRRTYAGLIVREVDRVERMVGALLGASVRRARAGEEGTTALRQLFDDLGLLVEGRFRRGGVRLIVEDSPLIVRSAREPLAQILLNLLLNAVAQAPRASSVSLGAEAHGDGNARLSVADSGPGVPSDAREAIFAPFYSGTGGSGLGLSVVRRLCDENGWPLDLVPTSGGGATFRIIVPLAATGHEVSSGQQPSPPRRQPPKSGAPPS